MSDLVKRLRVLSDDGSYEPEMHHTAADRIEALEAEVARLREALALYANGKNWGTNGPLDPACFDFVGATVARAALKGDGQ